MQPKKPFRPVNLNRTAALFLAATALSATLTLSSSAQSTNSPTLTYCSLFGGGGDDMAYGLTRDTAGYVYIVGRTGSANAFATPFTSLFDPASIGAGTFVVKFNPTTKALVYRTLIAACTGRAIAVDASGNAYIAGEARDYAWYFPSTNAYQAAYAGGDFDAFVAKLSADGSRLLYCTYLGGDRVDMARRIAVDNAGQAIVMGITDSTNFPITANGVLQTNLAGGRDTFVVKLDATGTNLLYSSYLGGRRDDDGTGLAVDTNGNVFVSGRSTSTNFSAAVNPARLGPLGTDAPENAFIAKLAPDFKAVQYLTLFGGSGEDCGSAVAVDGSGNAFVFGQTASTDFPVTTNAFQTEFGSGGEDNFVVKLNSSGSDFIYATYLGNGGEYHLETLYISDNYPYWYLPTADLVIDAAGNAYVAGRTGSADIAHGVPTASQLSGRSDGYVAKLNPSASALLYLRFLGGWWDDAATALAADGAGNVFVAGSAGYSMLPPYFPTTSAAFQTQYGGDWGDAFFAQLSETVPPLANDAFANRTLLSGTSRLTVQADNTAATHEPGEPAHAGQPAAKSLWWSWTAPVNGVLNLTTEGSSFDTLLAVYTGSTLAGLQVVASNAASPSVVRFPVAAGTAYQIAVDGQNGASGSVSLSLTFSAPPNDDFANRFPLSGYPTVFGSNVDATIEPDELLIPRDPLVSLHTDWLGSRSVWWTWTAPESTDVELSTLGSDFNTVLAVYSGSALTNLAVLKCSAQEVLSNGVWTSRVTLKAEAGATYQIVVNGLQATAGAIQLTVGPSAPPANDNFATRTVLTNSLVWLTNYNGSATTEPGEPSLSFPSPAGRTLWWTWTAPSNGWIIVSTAGSDFDTRLAAFTGDNLTNLTLVAANDEYVWWVPYSYFSRLSFEVTSNTAYSFVVDGGGQAPSGKLVLNLYFYQPPKIVLGSVGWRAGGTFGFQVQGWPRPYRVEASTNLINWALVLPTNLVGPAFSFTDTNAAGFRQRFYRVTEVH